MYKSIYNHSYYFDFLLNKNKYTKQICYLLLIWKHKKKTLNERKVFFINCQL